MQRIFNIFITFLESVWNVLILRDFILFLMSLAIFGFVWNRYCQR